MKLAAGGGNEQHDPEQSGGGVRIDVGSCRPTAARWCRRASAMAATAARNKALRGGSRNASPPTGTKNSSPRPLATPPQVWSRIASTSMSTVACSMVWTYGARQAAAHQNDADQARSTDKRPSRRRKAARNTTANPRAPPKEYSPTSTSGTRTRYRLRTPSTRQLSAGLRIDDAVERAIQGGSFSGRFALPSSLIQNSAPYATRSTPKDNS